MVRGQKEVSHTSSHTSHTHTPHSHHHASHTHHTHEKRADSESLLRKEQGEFEMYRFVKISLTLLIILFVLALAVKFIPIKQEPLTPVDTPVVEPKCLFEIKVCGADNVTYDSSCKARENKVPILYYGDCGAAIVCNHGGKIVCGTDNQTYPNECTALHVANVGVYAEGPCA
ncbi:MAG TPA: Kazal-type serine protease inhibitor [Acidobacteriota bacterium]|nr:Kazal-type serine protease inhibitor [Acidobacteriota bacterium]